MIYGFNFVQLLNAIDENLQLMILIILCQVNLM